MAELHGMRRPAQSDLHRVRMADGVTYTGTWEQIVFQMRRDDRECTGESLVQYMEQVAQRSRAETGIVIPVADAESFLRGAAAAGRLVIAG